MPPVQVPPPLPVIQPARQSPPLLHQTGTHAIEPGPVVRGRIGIWTRGTMPGCRAYTIDPAVDWSERRLWADQHTIPERSPADYRIVFVGESVARGFFLDPHWTPACHLQQLLAQAFPSASFDVVDLARTCLTDPLLLVIEALELRPDAVVLFFGNNLSLASIPDFHGESSECLAWRERIASSLTRGAWGELGVWIEDEADRLVFEPFLNSVATVLRQARMPCVVVVPQVNVADWRTPPEWVPAFPRAGAVDDPTAATGRPPAGPGPGVSGAAPWTIGDGAEGWLEALAGLPPVPRCSPGFRRGLRTWAAREGAQLVDLEATLSASQTGGPGRRFFYDYCHLTPEGIDLAMRSTAQAVLQALGLGGFVARPGGTAALVPPNVEAMACFLAGLHNAHWSQSPELVDYWFAQAVARHPGIVDAMSAYLESVGRPTPLWIGMRGRFLGDPRTQAGRLLFNAVVPSNDCAVVSAMERYAGSARIQTAQAAAQRLAELLVAGVSLLDLRATDAFARHVCHGLLLACLRPSLRIPFFAREGIELELALVLRCPGRRTGGAQTSGGRVGLVLNAARLGEASVGTGWTEWRLRIPARMLQARENELKILWHGVACDGASAREALTSFRCGGSTSPFPVFGEVHRCSRLREVGDDE